VLVGKLLSHLQKSGQHSFGHTGVVDGRECDAVHALDELVEYGGGRVKGGVKGGHLQASGLDQKRRRLRLENKA
jgi:hypothetical protein